MIRRCLLAAMAAIGLASPAVAQSSFTRTEDVIYARKFGLAMTMDVFEPKEKPNGKGIIFCVSGGWVSDKLFINPSYMKPFVDRGYTVFAVLHGAQPKFTIPEVLEDMHKAVPSSSRTRRSTTSIPKSWALPAHRPADTSRSCRGARRSP